MGALIRTKGTIRLACHFNEEFSTHIDYYQGIADRFDTTAKAWTNLLDLTNNLKDAHSPRKDMKCLLPPPHPMHSNLVKRWLWFLNVGNVGQGALTQANHKAIADAIYQALIDPDNFQCITFDAVEAGAQQVVANPVRPGTSGYMQIVLQTAVAMPVGPVGGTNDPPPLD